MVRHAAGLPPALSNRPLRLLRPRDAGDVYASNPTVEFARLAERGLLHRVASGYYVIVPADRIGDPSWRPPLIDTAWAIAAADYGVDAVAAVGPSAARYHGLIPRELAVAFVAAPKQRPKLILLSGTAHYLRRDVKPLDLERWTSQLGQGWVTSLEQTALDLATHRFNWTLPASELDDALDAAMPRLNRELVRELGAAQRRQAAAHRL